MDLKNTFKNIFEYHPPPEYEFSLPDDDKMIDSFSSQNYSEKITNEPQNIFTSLEVNLDYIKTKYNLLINSDIIVRRFILNARGKQYKAFILYIDGMVDSKILNNFVLEPLMLRNNNNLFNGEQNRIISEAVTNNITVRKVKKFDLAEYVESCLIPQNSIKKSKEFSVLFAGVNSGDCILFIDTLNVAFDIDVKGFKQRSIDIPQNENVIKGSHEAFIENLRTNTSIIRRLINNENLIIENIEVGNITKTKCAVCYMHNITNTELVSEVKFRISNLDIDSLLSAGQLEQFISDTSTLGLPRIISTERPDNTVQQILEGRVAVLINGAPYSLIMPAVLIDFIASPEDSNLKTPYSNFLKFLRLLACIITLFLPSFYVAITSFHQEILPTELLFSILASREGVPFPVIFEILIMELSFELIRESGIRVPSPIGSTVGIVGGLILGQAAVSAGIVSPILIIIVAITGISSFAIPDFTFGFHLRYYRFLFIILGFMSGFLGIGIGIFAYVSAISDLETFGVSYTSPYVPSFNTVNNKFFLPPIWKRESREKFLSSKRAKRQSKTSMNWRFK